MKSETNRPRNRLLIAVFVAMTVAAVIGAITNLWGPPASMLQVVQREAIDEVQDWMDANIAKELASGGTKEAAI